MVKSSEFAEFLTPTSVKYQNFANKWESKEGYGLEHWPACAATSRAGPDLLL